MMHSQSRSQSPLFLVLVVVTLAGGVAACAPPASPGEGEGEGEGAAAGEGEGEGAAAGEGEGEGEGEGVPAGWTCDASFVGDGSCDCGCGAVDTDCASSDPSLCEFDDCAGNAPVDTNNNALCQPPPAGFTCDVGAAFDGFCDCGCGVPDPECPANATRADCEGNGCPDGQSPGAQDPTTCFDNPPGWTCDGLLFGNGSCDCGCGVNDSDCPASPTLADCHGSDNCAADQSPDPSDPTQCIQNAPEDDWTCDVALILDGTCDCGCGSLDPDCANSDAASCVNVHCQNGDELVPGNNALCQENCNHTSDAAGTGTCTNGGDVSFSNACTDQLSACGDGHDYEVECDGSGTCVCRVDSVCIHRADDGFCSTTAGTINSVCGFTLVDGTGN